MVPNGYIKSPLSPILSLAFGIFCEGSSWCDIMIKLQSTSSCFWDGWKVQVLHLLSRVNFGFSDTIGEAFHDKSPPPPPPNRQPQTLHTSPVIAKSNSLFSPVFTASCQIQNSDVMSSGWDSVLVPFHDIKEGWFQVHMFSICSKHRASKNK